MKELTLKELADIGADAAFANNKGTYYMNVWKKSHSWDADEPARQAFAEAVRDAVLADLVAKSDSLPDPFAELKAAHAAGEMIQIKALSKNGVPIWQDVPQPLFNCSKILYRIKPEPVLVPLDIDDIRATDEFRKTTSAVCVATIWTSEFIWLSGTAALKYSTLATTYERRQHGSNEWKPCTKETE